MRKARHKQLKRSPCYSCKQGTRGRLGGVPLCFRCLRRAHGGRCRCGCSGCTTDFDKGAR